MSKFVTVVSTHTPNPKRHHVMVIGWNRTVCGNLPVGSVKVVDQTGLPHCVGCWNLMDEIERNCQMICPNCDYPMVFDGTRMVCAMDCGGARSVPMVDPELERLLAEEEEIERRTQAQLQTRTVRPLVLNELEFLRLIADARSAETKRKLGDFYNENRDQLVMGSVVIRVD